MRCVRVRVCFVSQRGVNLVEGNVVINTQDNGIQFSSGVVVRNNIVVGAGYYGIFLSNNQNQQSGVYSNVQIVHNTVYNSGSSDLYLPVRAGPSIVIIPSPARGLSNSTASATVQALSGSQFVIANNAFLSSTNAFAVQTQTNTVWLKNAYVTGSAPAGTRSSPR
jgi:hypothetical protein